MKQPKRIKDEVVPTLIVLSIDDIFSEDEPHTVSDFLREVPTEVALNYIIHEHLEIHYSHYARRAHIATIFTLRNTLGKNEKKALQKMQKKYFDKLILFNTEATLQFCYESIRNYVPFEEPANTDLQPTEEELVNIYKAYLTCNKFWTSKQHFDEHANAIDLMLKLEVPFSEFQFPKDPVTQIYKALRFFEFCNRDNAFQQYMKAFLEDNHVDSYKEYLILLLGRAYETLKNPVIPYNPEDNKFFHKYIIQLSEIPHEEWNKEIGLPFFRNHFLFQLSDRSLLVVNPDLMVDKIYQGLKFMMYRSVCKHELPSPKGKPFKDFSAFSSSLGENFSEGELLGPILNQSLEKWSDLFKTGQDFRNQSIVGEPDFYIRKDDSLLLVEFKDVTLSESSKQSDDVGVVKNDILKRLCWDDGRSRKGVGQLLWNINRLKDGDFRLIDTSYMDIKNIYPILVTTDNVFSSSGVNALIEENCKQLLKQYSFSDDFTIYNPVIIDIDTLIELSYQLSEERYDIIKLIRGYYKNKYYKIISFKRYIRQYCKIEGEKLRERNKFLFGDLLQIS